MTTKIMAEQLFYDLSAVASIIDVIVGPVALAVFEVDNEPGGLLDQQFSAFPSRGRRHLGDAPLKAQFRHATAAGDRGWGR
jgi:hypothetical protein